jgi:hypothetical protein
MRVLTIILAPILVLLAWGAWQGHSSNTSGPIKLAGLATAGYVVLLLCYLAFYVPRHLSFQLTPQTLTIQGDALYGRTISREDLNADRAVITPLDEADPYRPTLRLNGVGLPNYLSGWFSTSKEGKALVFARPARKAIAIPTKKRYCLLLSPEDPEQFLIALRTPSSQHSFPLAR